MKPEEKFEAAYLRRRLGKSYNEIRRKVKVSKSTLSLWLRNIKLSNVQRRRLINKQIFNPGGKVSHEKRLKRTKEIINKAKKEVILLAQNPLFLAGLMLYCAEGGKAQEKVRFSNSNTVLVRLMMKWFRKFCQPPENKYRVAIHIHEFISRKNSKQYWSKVTGIPTSQFYKTNIKPPGLSYRKNPLYNGTCHITIDNRDLFRKIKGWTIGFFKKEKLVSKDDHMPL